MATSTSLTDFAITILRNAATIEDFFKANEAIPRPSFSPDGPPAFPCPPEATDIYQARETMLDAAKKLYQLALGPVESLFELTLRCHDSASLHTIYRFNIAGQIPLDGEKSFTEIAQAIKIDEDRVRRILRLAMCNGLFKEPRPGFVAHTGMSAIMAQDVISVNAVVGHVIDDIYPASCKVADSIEKYPEPKDRLVETPFGLAFDTKEPFFNYIEKHPHRVNRFHQAMKALNSSGPCSGETMAKGYDWSPWKDGTFVDVGGSTGHTTLKIAQNSQIASFVVQDFSADEVTKSQSQLAPEHQGRVTFMQHDFFKPQPVKGADAYFFRLIFHDWPDKECVQILRNHVPAMKQGASILVCDLLLPEPNTVPMRVEKEMRNSDLHMLCLNGSCERDIGAWERLFAEADARFKLVGAKQPHGQALSIVEARWEELEN